MQYKKPSENIDCPAVHLPPRLAEIKHYSWKKNLNLKVRELRSNYAKDEFNTMPSETLHALHECSFKALFGHDAFLQWFCTSRRISTFSNELGGFF